MVTDTDLQVWLDTYAAASQTVMVPYVRSHQDARVTYDMRVMQQHGGSTARINQKGQVNTPAEQATALTRVALNVQQDSECRVELSVSEDGKEAVLYRFDCAGSQPR